MLDVFTHAQLIECPECPRSGQGNKKPNLTLTSRNYSGSGIDIGNCPECGKAFCISYKIANIDRISSWDKPKRVEIESERIMVGLQERAIAHQEKEKKELEEYERLKEKFGGESKTMKMS